MKRTLLLFLLSTLFIYHASACLNYYYSLDKEGNLNPLGENWLFPFNKNFNIERNVTKLVKLENRLKTEKSFMLLSDYAVCLMKLEKQKEALEILIRLYKHYPNEYQIASNLGTAYELNGQVDSSLKYIHRGMELNPDDHEGSEWVHIKVLEAKKELQNNPSYLDKNTVLHLNDKQKNDSLVLKHIFIQLQERVPFTQGHDEIMASLFTDLGDISANVVSIEYARAYYQIAKNYYGGKTPSLGEKIKKMEKLINKYASEPALPSSEMGEEHMKVGYFKYTVLLQDNDGEHYQVDWGKINLDVNSLLALVDFTKTEEEIKKDADNSGQSADGLNLVAGHVHDTSKTGSEAEVHSPTSLAKDFGTEKKNYTLLYIFGAAFPLILAFLIYNRKKKSS